MEPGIYAYKGKFFQLEDLPEGAHFKSLDGDYYFSRVAVPYIFQGKKSSDMNLEDFFSKPEEVKKVKVAAGIIKENQT